VGPEKRSRLEAAMTATPGDNARRAFSQAAIAAQGDETAAHAFSPFCLAEEMEVEGEGGKNKND
jgi:hypothetical protein